MTSLDARSRTGTASTDADATTGSTEPMSSRLRRAAPLFFGAGLILFLLQPIGSLPLRGWVPVLIGLAYIASGLLSGRRGLLLAPGIVIAVWGLAPMTVEYTGNESGGMFYLTLGTGLLIAALSDGATVKIETRGTSLPEGGPAPEPSPDGLIGTRRRARQAFCVKVTCLDLPPPSSSAPANGGSSVPQTVALRHDREASAGFSSSTTEGVDVASTQPGAAAGALSGVDVLDVHGESLGVLTRPPVGQRPALHGLSIHPDAGVVKCKQGAHDHVLLEAARDGVVVVDRQGQAFYRLYYDRVESGGRLRPSRPITEDRSACGTL